MKIKKIAAVVLSLALVTALSTTAFAGSSTHTEVGTNDEVIPVTGAYSGTGTILDVYSVDIEWGEMAFTYNTTGDKQWNPETHKYNFTEGDGWTVNTPDTGDKITVTNHSNLPVDVAFSFTKDSNSYKGEYTGTVNVIEGNTRLEAGVENHPTDAKFVKGQLVLDGTLNVVETTSTTLGTVTVALSAVSTEP